MLYLAFIVTCVNILSVNGNHGQLNSILRFYEPDVTLMRLPFYDI